MQQYMHVYQLVVNLELGHLQSETCRVYVYIFMAVYHLVDLESVLPL